MKRGFILPTVIFVTLFLMALLTFGFALLYPGFLTSESEYLKEEFALESLLRIQFAGENGEKLEDEVLKEILIRNQDYSFPYTPQTLGDLPEAEGMITLKKDDVRGKLTLRRNGREMEAFFSLWHPEVLKEEPYLLLSESSDSLRKDITESFENPVFITEGGRPFVAEIPEGKTMILENFGHRWKLSEYSPEDSEEIQEGILFDRNSLYIVNRGGLIVRGSGNIFGSVYNSGEIFVEDEPKVHGIWMEIGVTEGNPIVNGKVILKGEDFSGSATYDFISMVRYGKHLKFLYHLRPEVFKISPHDYFKN